MTLTRGPGAGVDVAGELAPTTTPVSGDCGTSPRASPASPPGELGGVLPWSFGDPRLLLPGEGASGPDVQLVTRAGDIHVELTVGEGDIHPLHALDVTVEVGGGDDRTLSAWQ